LYVDQSVLKRQLFASAHRHRRSCDGLKTAKSEAEIELPVPTFASAIETEQYLKPLPYEAELACRKAGPAPQPLKELQWTYPASASTSPK
jgi:hypothetical protein